jgi:invasion protein IalB
MNIANFGAKLAVPLMVGCMIGATGAFAQAAAPAAAAPAAGAAPSSSWVKLCQSGVETKKDKDGKETKIDHKVCLTNHERIDASSGNTIVSTALKQLDDSKDMQLLVMVPLGMVIAPGMKVIVYPKDLWEKIQKGENVDESKLMIVDVPYDLCHSGGCTGSAPAKPELIEAFKSNTAGGLLVISITGLGRPVAFPVPLNGFDTALTGPPASNEEYAKQRNALMQQIAENQQKLIEEYRKQNAELQKSQGGKPGAAAPAAKGAPPPAKK